MTSVPDRLMAAPHWKSAGSVRVPPGDPSPLVRLMSRLGGWAMGGGQIRLLLTLGGHRVVLRAYLRFGFGLVVLGGLPRPAIELVTLRTAWNAGCRYAFFHHMFLARAAGIGWETIERVSRGPHCDGWNDRARTLLTAADELHSRRGLTAATRKHLAEFIDEGRILELCFLVGHYEMLAMFLDSAGVEPEPGAWRHGPVAGLLARRRIG